VAAQALEVKRLARASLESGVLSPTPTYLPGAGATALDVVNPVKVGRKAP
jgi:hypothetical protein